MSKSINLNSYRAKKKLSVRNFEEIKDELEHFLVSQKETKKIFLLRSKMLFYMEIPKMK